MKRILAKIIVSFVVFVTINASFLISLGRPKAQAVDFLKTNGFNLSYKGTNVRLQGVNFDNIGALGANIGTGKVESTNNLEEDYATLSSMGANHVRYGMSFSWYQYSPTTMFQYMDKHIAWAKKYNLFISFNMFTTPGDCYEGYGNSCGFWGSESEQNALRDFWVAFAARYKNEPAVAGYDLLNEPTPPWQGPGCNLWFDIAQKIRDAITVVDPNHLIFISACSDPSFGGRIFKNSDGSKATNVIYQVHDYDPMAFSHPGYNASGTSASYPGTAQVWTNNGSEDLYFDKTTFAGTKYAQYSTASKYSVTWAKQNGVPLYIGEWGAQNWTKGYTQYIKDKAEVYNSLGVHHAHYGWRHDVLTGWRWGMYDWNGPLTLRDPAKLEAVKVSWLGAVKPNFAGGTVITTAPTPTTAVTSVPTPKPSTVLPTVGTTVIPSGSSFLQTDGYYLKFNGQRVYLRGANYANIQALKATVGPNGSWIWGSNVGVGNVYVTEDDYKKMAELGGNHFRFGMSFSWWKEDKTNFYKLLDQQIAWGKKYGVWLVLNQFTTPGNCYEGYSNYCGIWTSDAEKTDFTNFWVELATRYANEPVIAGYDLLNEPTPPGPGWSSTWYDLAQKVRDAIWNVDKNHLVFIAATSDMSFQKKFNGTNIVYQVHDYLPLAMSHCVYSGAITYPGNAPNWDGTQVFWDKNSFSGKSGSSQANLYERMAFSWAKTNNVPIYVGEWGPSGSCLSGYVQYIQDHADIYKEAEVSHSVYSWRAGVNHWGTFPDTGALVPYDQNKLNAIASSFQGAGKPNFSGVGVTTVPTTASCPKKANGDADCNGAIELGDFAIFREEYISFRRSELTIANAKSNFVVDTTIDLEDFEAFRLGYLSSRQTSSLYIPKVEYISARKKIV